ncbi:MAG: hypothetical protein NTY94_17125 [Alphaproteobacteria bacterium]|nr:hypothetical protein [Alphaproteobacteria bacterium]
MNTATQHITPTATVLGMARAAQQESAPAAPDALLIRMCEEFDALDSKVAGQENDPNLPDKAAHDAEINHWHNLVDTITRTPATTLEGLKAKASVFRPIHAALTGEDALDFATLKELTFARQLVLDILRVRS